MEVLGWLSVASSFFCLVGVLGEMDKEKNKTIKMMLAVSVVVGLMSLFAYIYIPVQTSMEQTVVNSHENIRFTCPMVVQKTRQTAQFLVWEKTTYLMTPFVGSFPVNATKMDTEEVKK
jgi:hypothetical protein